jgi:hypothetical protein
MRKKEELYEGRHKASLNFSDYAAHALAVVEAEPLRFKGTDFGATDVSWWRQGRKSAEFAQISISSPHPATLFLPRFHA